MILTLTLAQARYLQRRDEAGWPHEWAFLNGVQVPDKPSNAPDPERYMAGVRMVQLGCQREQLAEQLMFTLNGSTMRGLYRAAPAHAACSAS